MLCYIMLYFILFYYIILYYVMLRYVMLCYIILYYCNLIGPPTYMWSVVDRNVVMPLMTVVIH